MKTLKHLVLYSVILLIFTNNSCKKPETPTGNNTFSCYIDGELFVPEGGSSIYTPGPISDGLSLYAYDEHFTAYARNSESIIVYFNIGADWGVGTFYLVNSNGLFRPSDPYDINHAIVEKNGIKYLSKEGSGNITIIESSYPESGGIKGTFEFTLYNENDDTDVIHVTNGKFDD